MMSKGYEDEQAELKVKISELSAVIEEKEQIDIYYRFNIAVSTAIADQREYDKKRKAA